MSAEKKYTERDVILRERQAFTDGAYCWLDGSRRCLRSVKPSDIETDAVCKFPIPKVTRPRVVTDDFGVLWRYRTSALQWKHNTGEWTFGLGSLVVNASRVKLWADLYANPTETVDAE